MVASRNDGLLIDQTSGSVPRHYSGSAIILTLRQQLAVFKHRRSRPRIDPGDRMFWVFLRSAWRNWANALIVEPDTVVQWHRQGFKWFWRWTSRTKKVGRPRVAREVQELIRQMAQDNPRQLHRAITQFVSYYHQDRSHLGLGKDAPGPRAATPQPSPGARVAARLSSCTSG